MLRASLRGLLKPGLQAGRPVESQRRWLAAVARLTRVPRAATFRPSSLGGVPGEWVDSGRSAAESPVILYLHGGAYCVGSPATHRAITGYLSIRCLARVFAADYRLAPEHPFPAAVEDAVAAYSALLESGCRPDRLVIAGDSAGGGLSVAAALQARELGLPLPSSLVLFSPWADLGPRPEGPGAAHEVMLTPEMIAESAQRYLAGRDARDPLASPVHADLAGLPPTLIQVGTDELLLDDSRHLHARMREAGVEATLRIYPRRWHVFQSNAGMLGDADRALEEVARFISGVSPP